MSTIASYVLMVTGAIVLLFAVVAIAVIAYDAFTDWMATPNKRSFDDGCAHVRHRLLSDAWWFGESPETMVLLQDIARGMDVSQAREKWRKARENQIAPSGHR